MTDEQQECIFWLDTASEQDDGHAAHALRQAWPKVRDLALSAFEVRAVLADFVSFFDDNYEPEELPFNPLSRDALLDILARARIRALPIPSGADLRGEAADQFGNSLRRYLEVNALTKCDPETGLPAEQVPSVADDAATLSARQQDRGAPPAPAREPAEHRPLHAPGSKPNDWREDFYHENGQYACHCSDCGETFVGHKRRMTCKVCADRNRRTPA